MVMIGYNNNSTTRAVDKKSLNLTVSTNFYSLCLCLVIRLMKQVTALQLFLDVTKKAHSRFLGLDVGDKYVGLALSDFDNKIASPFSVLVRKKSNICLMASDFESLISQYSLKGFVIGIPFDRHRISSDAVQVKALINDLSKTKMLQSVQYTYWNECFTSKNVDLFLKALDMYHPYHSKTMLDKFAAVGILQGYLDYANRKVKLETEQDSLNRVRSQAYQSQPLLF